MLVSLLSRKPSGSCVLRAEAFLIRSFYDPRGLFRSVD